MRTAAILPVKRFSEAKQRLGASVADSLRVELARAMVTDVLRALHDTAAIERTIVVTREQQVAASARSEGALIVQDAAEDGQSTAAALGIEHALVAGMERVLCVPGDCPTLDPAELGALLLGSAAGEPEVVIVPDRHGTGTNGLLLTPPAVISPSFGPDSCERHRELALAAGATCRVERRFGSLLLDIDTSEDLAVLRERLSGDGARRARTRTRALLSQSFSTAA